MREPGRTQAVGPTDQTLQQRMRLRAQPRLLLLLVLLLLVPLRLRLRLVAGRAQQPAHRQVVLGVAGEELLLQQGSGSRRRKMSKRGSGTERFDPMQGHIR